MTTTIQLTKFSIPTTIDVSNGAVDVPFSIVAALAPGVAIDDVTLLMNLSGDTVSFKSSGTLTDSFDDATPNFATTVLHVDGTTRAGFYAIDSLVIRDKAGNVTTYGGLDLHQAGFPDGYEVVNKHAPTAPTIALQDATGTTFDRASATLTGLAAPGSKVSVRGLDDDFADYTWVELGSATAGADGRWTLKTAALDNGSYALVRATATLDGNTSAYSRPVAFHIAANAPNAPVLHTHLDGLGNAATPTPFVAGLTSSGATVAIFDGATQVGSATAGRDGWFGTATAPLAAGAHSLTAVATDAAGHASAPGKPLALTVDAHAGSGIVFDIASLKNTSGQQFDQSVVQGLLNEVSAIVSGAIAGNEHIGLEVTIEDKPDGNPDAAAAAGPGPMSIDPATGMPLVPHAFLYLSTNYVNQVLSLPQLARNDVAVITHELLHVLAFHSTVDAITHQPQPVVDPFGHLTQYVGDTPYFTGYYASAINGGAVALHDRGHLATTSDLMYAGTSDSTALTTYFSPANPTAPLTGLDLAILKDCGYTIKDAFASQDGHTFVAGEGTPGHDQVVGTAGQDTLVVNAKAAAFKAQHVGTGTDLVDTAHGVTQHLSGIERVQFTDATLRLDTDHGQIGGEAYRLYQAAFHRTPDADGLNFWIDALDHGASLEGVADAFAKSPEFATLYGANTTDREFIDLLYRNALHREPDASGEAFWIDGLHSSTRALVLIGFSESAENVAAVGATIGSGFTLEQHH